MVDVAPTVDATYRNAQLREKGKEILWRGYLEGRCLMFRRGEHFRCLPRKLFSVITTLCRSLHVQCVALSRMASLLNLRNTEVYYLHGTPIYVIDYG